LHDVQSIVTEFEVSYVAVKSQFYHLLLVLFLVPVWDWCICWSVIDIVSLCASCHKSSSIPGLSQWSFGSIFLKLKSSVTWNGSSRTISQSEPYAAFRAFKYWCFAPVQPSASRWPLHASWRSASYQL